jgi:prepilin-type processing-associated H-X9-DG protein
VISELTDGTSNTILIAEDAGRDPRFISPYNEGYYNGLVRRPIIGQGPAGGLLVKRRYWRWAEPDNAFGVSGQPNNPYRPMYENAEWAQSGITAGNNGGANDEMFSYHPGGVNVLLGDGSVRFLRNSIAITILRSVVTPKGGEVVSADAY